MKHVKKILSYSIAGGLGLSTLAMLQGCSEQPQSAAGSGDSELAALDAQQQNVFLVLEQTGTDPDTYALLEKHPTTGQTRAILREPDGTERFLSEAELQEIAAAEAARVEAGESRLTEDPSMMSGGLSLGEVLLASAAGALIGGMLANSLMGNSNFQRTQQNYGGGRPTAAVSQPYRASSNTANNQARSGFFGGNKGSTSSSRSTSFRSFGS